jgi:choline dehydrogenase-like flavoprotein
LDVHTLSALIGTEVFHVGGKSLMWGRQSYRFSDHNFEDNAKDGYGNDWPIRYKDVTKGYDYVENLQE